MYSRFMQLLQENNVTPYRVSKETGVTQTTLSDWKTGRGTPKASTLKKIAEYFNVSIDWLTGLSKYRNDRELKEYSWKEYDMIEKFPGSGDYFDPAFDFGEFIKEERVRQGISAKELADCIEYTEEDYLQIEDGEKPLTQQQAKRLCENLYITIEDVLIEHNLIDSKLYNIDDEPEISQRDLLRAQRAISHENDMLKLENASRDLYPEELEGIKKYRELDSHGKDLVRLIINKEYERCSAPVKTAPMPTIKIKHSTYKASAGFGFDLEERDEWDEIEVPDTPEANAADFAVTIFGNSMEPIYFDGDIVLVRVQEQVNIGETGIFIVNGQGFIKQYGGDRLISVNSNYDDIIFSEGDFIKCAGKVIGTVKA